MSRRAAAVLGLALAALAAGCEERTAVERGRSLFLDPGLSPSDRNYVACVNCHSTGEPRPPSRLPGGTLIGVAGRESYFGGEIRALRGAVGFCLRFFMRHPDDEPLAADDPEGQDLLAYLETLGTAPSPPVGFTIPARVSDLPSGDPGRGAETWTAACATCHGAPHTGERRRSVLVPILPEETLIVHGDEARLATIEKVRHGQFFGIGGDMPPFSLEVLPDGDLSDVLAFLGY